MLRNIILGLITCFALTACGSTVRNDFVIYGDHNNFTCTEYIAPIVDKTISPPISIKIPGGL